MSEKIIYCFNHTPEKEGECIYQACPMFSEEIDMCKLEYLKPMKQGSLVQPPRNPVERKPVKDQPQRKLDSNTIPINQLKAGDTSTKENKINVEGTLLYDPTQKDFNRSDGSMGTVTNILIEDDTGKLNITFWDDAGRAALKLVKGDSVVVENVYQINNPYQGTLQANAGKYFKIHKQ